MLILLLDQRFETVFSNAVDPDLAGDHLFRLQGAAAQSLNYSFIIMPLITQH